MSRHPEAILAVNMDPLDFLHLEEALEQTPHPQQGDQGQTQQIYPAEGPTEALVSIGLPGRQGLEQKK